MASIANDLSSESESLHGYKLYAVVGIGVGTLIILLVFSILLWIHYRKKATKEKSMKLPIDNLSSINQNQVNIRASDKGTFQKPVEQPNISSSSTQSEDRTIEKAVVHIRDNSIGIPSSEGSTRTGSDADVGKPPLDKPTMSRTQAANVDLPGYASTSTEQIEKSLSLSLSAPPPPLSSHAGPEPSHFGWGHWYTLRELEVATNHFSNSNIVGKGGYGVVYLGILADGSSIAVKNLVNNRGQAEREFKVEVEAIGRVRHKNLVRLLGYCMEGVHRMLVYEFIDNGNLDQWLHGSLGENKPIPWDTRMKIIIGTARGLAYLHEGLEPKVVHRDVKASNILLDSDWNPRVSDFGLAKLLGSENSHVTTRVMGTFGYVAPEYASTGLLNEKSDVYSYGVLLMEMITGRDPVDYSRPQGEVNLVDWLKMMVGNRRSDEVADPKMETRPSMRSLKRALLVSLKCVDPDAQKRPKMSQVIHMLEMDDNPFRTEKGNHMGRNPRHFQRHQGFPLDHGASSYHQSPRSKNREARS